MKELGVTLSTEDVDEMFTSVGSQQTRRITYAGTRERDYVRDCIRDCDAHRSMAPEIDHSGRSAVNVPWHIECGRRSSIGYILELDVS